MPVCLDVIRMMALLIISSGTLSVAIPAITRPFAVMEMEGDTDVREDSLIGGSPTDMKEMQM